MNKLVSIMAVMNITTQGAICRVVYKIMSAAVMHIYRRITITSTPRGIIFKYQFSTFYYTYNITYDYCHDNANKNWGKIVAIQIHNTKKYYKNSYKYCCIFKFIRSFSLRVRIFFGHNIYLIYNSNISYISCKLSEHIEPTWLNGKEYITISESSGDKDINLLNN